MRQRMWGRVIHVTSLAVKQPIDGLMLSTSIRAAVTGFSRTLANEVAADGITVNTVLPGFMNTDRVVELNEVTAAREGVPVEAVERRVRGQIPMGRIGEPRELAAMSLSAASIPGRVLLTIGTFAPSLVALALTIRRDGREGARRLLQRLFRSGATVRWYVFAALYMVTVKLIVAVIHRVAFGAWPR